jgi:hypothetical protein
MLLVASSWTTDGEHQPAALVIAAIERSTEILVYAGNASDSLPLPLPLDLCVVDGAGSPLR